MIGRRALILGAASLTACHHNMLVQYSSPMVAPAGLTLINGTSFTITGSGFGPKAANYDTPYSTFLNWDNCSHGQALSVRWTTWFPTGNTSSSDDQAYRANGFRSVNCPSLRSTGFLAGACNGVGSGTAVINNCLIKSHTRPTNNSGSGPFMFYEKWYEQADASWDTSLGSPADGNYKLMDYGTQYLGSGADDSFYMGAFLTTTTASGIGLNDDYGLGDSGLIQLSESGSAGLGNFGKHFLNRTIKGAWLEFQLWYYAAPDSTGRMRFDSASIGGNSGTEYDIFTGLVHNSSTLTIVSTLDPFTNRTTRDVSIGAYNRAYPGANQYRYFSDLYQDYGEGWFFLTNNSAWGSETIREIQPFTNWSDTSVTFTVNGGQLPAGTVYLHFRKAPWQGSGHQALGPYTLVG
jgi:hypothetical protein